MTGAGPTSTLTVVSACSRKTRSPNKRKLYVQVSPAVATTLFVLGCVASASCGELPVEEARRRREECQQRTLQLEGVTALSKQVAEVLVWTDPKPRRVTEAYKVHVCVRKETEPGVFKCVPEERVKEASYDFQGMNLSLNDLRTLSPEVADVLSQHIGGLSFDGLETVPLPTLKKLAQRSGDLSLDGMRALSVEQAAVLATHCGGLELNGLWELPAAVAQALGGHRGPISLQGLRAIAPEAANGLLPCVGLHIDGIQNVDGDTLRYLAKVEGALSLNGLKELSIDHAELLSSHKGQLNLNGLVSLPEPIGLALAKHLGVISLMGVTHTTAESVKALARQKDTGAQFNQEIYQQFR